MNNKEKKELIEFWDLWMECMEYALTNCKFEKDEPKELPLSNKMMVAVYAMHLFEQRKAKKEVAK